jgi:hypothetical protein
MGVPNIFLVMIQDCYKKCGSNGHRSFRFSPRQAKRYAQTGRVSELPIPNQ